MFAFSQQTINGSIMHDNVQRDYILYVPAMYNASNPTPLVFNFHAHAVSYSESRLNRKHASIMLSI